MPLITLFSAPKPFTVIKTLATTTSIRDLAPGDTVKVTVTAKDTAGAAVPQVAACRQGVGRVGGGGHARSRAPAGRYPRATARTRAGPR